jgi:exopolysaccharide biosynthesis polyprenyl glycosylphosphotransferase
MQAFAKRLMDVIISAVCLVALMPVWIVAGMLIRIGSRGPVFYGSRRVGEDHVPFTMYKFRTMYDGANDRQGELRQFNEMNGPVFKMNDDPRVTPLGRIFRKYSIDELPQFWNVLRGDMSLVGPRPLPEQEVRHFSEWQHERHLVKPGITCIWQISGRNHIADFDKWVQLDLDYIDQWSLWRDIVILLKTIPVVISGKGAL